MHRRLSSLLKSQKAPLSSPSWYPAEGDSESEVSTIEVGKDEPLPPALLKTKSVDYFYSTWSRTWKYRKMSAKATAEALPVLSSAHNDPWKEYGLVLVRTVPQDKNTEPTFQIMIKNEYIMRACQDVIPGWGGPNWHDVQVQMAHGSTFKPEIFLACLPNLIAYRDALTCRKRSSELESRLLSSVDLLISFVLAQFGSTIANIERLTSQGMITFDLLYTTFLPRTLVVARCAITGLERIYLLRHSSCTIIDGIPECHLELEGVDFIDHSNGNLTLGYVSTSRTLGHFVGSVPISSLPVFPLKFHPREAELRETVLQRGQKWIDLIGVHHMEYNGTAGLYAHGSVSRHRDWLSRLQVESRIMVDRAMFRRVNPDYLFPRLANLRDGELNMGPDLHIQLKDGERPNLSTEDLLITPAVVYGFSLSDKLWLEFDITQVTPVSWNADAFANLVLPDEHKNMLRSLIAAHYGKAGFDDFIRGKGAGLVVNLFGPPGVGKTFSAEATGDYVKRPLYMIGAGDLGTAAHDVEDALVRSFKLATAWKAIILIDEADVFLERRSLNDLHRNAMIAVFLRQVEYYRGILFLTTNRVQAFDEAFLSRIHVALHFTELSEASRAQLWRAFVLKAGIQDISDQEIATLAQWQVNGRQIKNAVATASSLAMGRGEALSVHHLEETLQVMNLFKEQFERIKVEEAPAAS
ncbi:P-loop containing nucleoside triphosphate hydrolase protein [Mycena albidolilacea]|uniref:P-loop containing nucleoside triphosphate hydrolase protein n=1 Tax=Mycena albidolilacea TaxID=1033008 RepID=A0AAD7F267_9AGAR|nr:P-loop containing nucleoside triphosphate hydrolase protein [Mycena albidolilacea]